MKLEPLLDYLQPRFGSIYADELTVEFDGVDVRPWTPEFRKAVVYFLVHEFDDALYGLFLNRLDIEVYGTSREEQAVNIVERTFVWEIGLAIYEAAVQAVPTLDQIIGDDKTGEDASRQLDVADWIDSHATAERLVEVAMRSTWINSRPAYRQSPARSSGSLLVQYLTPPQLLSIWNEVVGPAPSDLTDVEWELLVPLLSRYRKSDGEPFDQDLSRKRVVLNGIRYKFANDVPWSHVPRRYGDSRCIYQRYRLDLKSGLYARVNERLRPVVGDE